MASKELVPYTESQRDAIEEGLLNKELAHRRDHGIEVFLYWHSKNNVLSIFVTDVSANQSQSFTVPNDRGMDAFEHPFYYAPLIERIFNEEDGA
jgi:hypothetical protein